MKEVQNLYRQIPAVDELINDEHFKTLKDSWGQLRLREHIQHLLNDLREAIQAGKIQDATSFQAASLAARLMDIKAHEDRIMVNPVINCTGIAIHTNLGRAPLSGNLMNQVSRVAENYSNLEYRLDQGRRGSRYDAIEELLIDICGVEAALVVNNNAAAVMLILRELARGQSAIVSRGELVEIGGKFRVPDVMEESGARLAEVGTTNKTRLEDYEAALSEETACILKVHRSNFSLVGFSEEVSIKELAKLAHDHNTLLIYDLGSGLLHPEPPTILRHEPTVQEGVAAGCDLISFSGDKLLGGPQAGIIIGKKYLIDRLKSNPLTRALRCDKLTLTALQETLKIYPDVERINQEIPLYQMLSLSQEELAARATQLMNFLMPAGIVAHTQMTQAEIGGGSAPGIYYPSLVMAIRQADLDVSLKDLEQELRVGNPPVIAYIQKDDLLFDLRTVKEADLEMLSEAIQQAYKRARA